jgi:hypothetical protein
MTDGPEHSCQVQFSGGRCSTCSLAQVVKGMKDFAAKRDHLESAAQLPSTGSSSSKPTASSTAAVGPETGRGSSSVGSGSSSFGGEVGSRGGAPAKREQKRQCTGAGNGATRIMSSAKRSLVFADRGLVEDPSHRGLVLDPSRHSGPPEDVEDLSRDGEAEVVPCCVGSSSQRSNDEQPACSSCCASQHSNLSSSQVQCAQSLGLSASENESGNEEQDACLQTPVSSGQGAQSAAATREKRKRSEPCASPDAHALPQTSLAARHWQPTLNDLIQASLLTAGDLIACRTYDGAWTGTASLRLLYMWVCAVSVEGRDEAMPYDSNDTQGY